MSSETVREPDARPDALAEAARETAAQGKSARGKSPRETAAQGKPARKTAAEGKSARETAPQGKSAKRPGAIALLVKPPLSTRDKLDFSTAAFLIIKRSETVAAPGALCFPGGGVEPGETPREAVRREFREEVGVAIDVGRQIAENRTPTGAPLYWFAADVAENADRAPDGTPKITLQTDEVAAFEWRTLADLLDDSRFLANNLDIVRKIVSGEVSLD